MTFDEYRERSYFPALDGMRAICAFGVIAEHMEDRPTFDWLNGGLGVVMFFIISGYIITALALREERAIGSLSLSAFYIRRSMRLFPAYYLVLGLFTAMIAMEWIDHGKKAFFLASLPFYLLYIQDINMILCVPNLIRYGFPPFVYSWTLGIEEKFYLAWPLLGFWLWARRPRRRLVGTCVLLLGFSLAQASYRVANPGDRNWFWSNILQHYLPITMGCLLAQLLDHRGGFNRLKRLLALPGPIVITTIYILCHLASRAAIGRFPELSQVYSLVATFFLASLLTGQGILGRLLAARPMAWLGRLSYGIYLVHGIAIPLGQRLVPYTPGDWRRSVPAYVVVCALSVGMAYILAITIERPCIALGRTWSKRLIENRKKKHESVPELVSV